MTIINKENAEHYTWGESNDGWHYLNSASLSVIEEAVRPLGSEVRHYHNQSQQYFYVLQGEASIEIENSWYTVTANEGIHIKAGQKHALVNKTNRELRFLVISQPHSHGDRVIA